MLAKIMLILIFKELKKDIFLKYLKIYTKIIKVKKIPINPISRKSCNILSGK